MLNSQCLRRTVKKSELEKFVFLKTVRTERASESIVRTTMITKEGASICGPI